MEEKVSEAIAQSGSLYKMRVNHGNARDLDLGAKTQDALLCNQWAADIATQLGQVCRLDEFPGSLAKFKCASFRLCLLSYWLSPQALPQHVEARTIRKPRA